MELVSPKANKIKVKSVKLKEVRITKYILEIFLKISGVHRGRGSQFCESRLQH